MAVRPGSRLQRSSALDRGDISPTLECIGPAKLVDGQYRRMLPLAKNAISAWQELENKRIEIVARQCEVERRRQGQHCGSPSPSGMLLVQEPDQRPSDGSEDVAWSFFAGREVVAENQ